MASLNQTQPHGVNKMGKTHYKPLAKQHGSGKAWERHGNGMLCVNRPLRDLLCVDILRSYSYGSARKLVYESRDRMVNRNSSSKIL